MTKPNVTPSTGYAPVPGPGYPNHPEHAHPEARVLLYSQRNSDRWAWQAANYEIEDVIAEVDRVHLVAPQRRRLTRAQHAAEWVRNRAKGREWNQLVPHVQPRTVERDYDLFFGIFQFPYELPRLDFLRDWRRRCRKAVCVIHELWRPKLKQIEAYLPALDQFDHVFLANRSSVEPLAGRISATVSYLPFSIDVERFTPYPEPPPRGTDHYSMGRRSPAVHAALLDLVERERLTYLYDTLLVSRVRDYREHRLLVANMAKRSRYFSAYRINDNAERLEKTGGEEGLALRYFEGAAAGAVLLGSRPQCVEHDECFDWEDSTVDVAFDGSDLHAVLDSLDADPERVARIRRDNVVNSLRRHDALYRWQQVLDAAGLPHTPAMAARGERLERLAQLALADSSELADAGGAVRRGAWAGDRRAAASPR